MWCTASRRTIFCEPLTPSALPSSSSPTLPLLNNYPIVGENAYIQYNVNQISLKLWPTNCSGSYYLFLFITPTLRSPNRKPHETEKSGDESPHFDLPLSTWVRTIYVGEHQLSKCSFPFVNQRLYNIFIVIKGGCTEDQSVWWFLRRN